MATSNNNEKIERSSFPRQLAENVGFAFLMGFATKSGIHFLRGVQLNLDSPHPWRCGKRAFRKHVPASLRLGGEFALYEGLYTALECSFFHLRHKDDAWNHFLAGSAIGAVYDLRRVGLNKALSNTLRGFGGMASTALTAGLLFAAADKACRFADEILPTRKDQDQNGDDPSSTSSSEPNL